VTCKTRKEKKLLFFVFLFYKIKRASTLLSIIKMSREKILFVLTSHGQFPNGHPTGWYLPEGFFIKRFDFKIK
jgi:hypothetical protein